MKIVLSADLHLGRTSTKLPPEWLHKGRSISAWSRLVDAVIAAKADALLLCGDVVDSKNQLWETLGPLKDGIVRLHEAGISCISVSGNHDANTLPDLATQFPEETFTLLGRNGAWERKTLFRDHQAIMHVDGWSFPSAKVTEDPTESYSLQASDGLPVLAMVHGDLGTEVSPYAPLNLNRLQSLPVSAWLLGHIHKPQLYLGNPWVLMPGSPHPLDPGEPGSHHAWVTELVDGHLTDPLPFAAAGLRYETVDLVFESDDPVSIDAVHGKLQEGLSQLETSDLCLLRIRLSGTSSELDSLTENIKDLHAWTSDGYAVESVSMAIHPAVDLDQVAEVGPVPALLVNALNNLPVELRERIEKVLEDVHHQSEFSGKELPTLDLSHLPLTPLLEKTLRESLRQLT